MNKPFACPDRPLTCTCWDCGFTWRRGQNGSHSCVENLHAHYARLAEENAALKAVIARDGDIRRVQPVLDAALTDRDRLAERVRELEGMAAHERRRIAERDSRVAAQVAEAEGRLATLAEENRALRAEVERLRDNERRLQTAIDRATTACHKGFDQDFATRELRRVILQHLA